ncbi:MAG: N-acetylmuramic acid 6-phosphate etherase [Thiofilum sp.]|uniref:N-acetylmuramic acid 6-phosphate etherase n=1 Tax=Thiofilum sp. TaxID=2212733 RepID=UPI0025FF1A5E|nr:N-acetylmuramic acid 6-phosphate etherase [Thiofilum sp.]MBK8454383.1 N-acetylmuramic acid 6-phosphate etherase [Thiofilum sp.]
MNTEAIDPKYSELDLQTTDNLVSTFIDDQFLAIQVVKHAQAAIAQAVDAAVQRLEQGGRLIYVGAGTSGRLGVLDSTELLPTFSWPAERAVGVMAGGISAYLKAVEGAEDDTESALQALTAIELKAQDVVILLAASGKTPFTVRALYHARSLGALTIGIANNPNTALINEAEIGVLLATGAEVIAGSTRLKAGTAQKVALNTLSSAIMVKLHKVYGNLMVDMQPTNHKLAQRALRIVMAATGADQMSAQRVLGAADHNVKAAIVSLLTHLEPSVARERLIKARGNIRQALAQ